MNDIHTNVRPVLDRTQFEREMLGVGPALTAFCRSLTENKERAEDLVQDTYVKALKARETYTPGTNMKAWLFVIARNIFYTERRRAWRNVELDQTFAERVKDTSSNQAEKEELAQDFCATAPLLGFLPLEMRDSVVAIYFAGMKYEEAAIVLECEVGTVKSRVSRGTEMIRSLLSEQRKHPFNLSSWATAARDVPPTNPYYPIAKAYEEIYAQLATHPHLSLVTPQPATGSQDPLDMEWQNLLASGALDEDEEFNTLIR